LPLLTLRFPAAAMPVAWQMLCMQLICYMFPRYSDAGGLADADLPLLTQCFLVTAMPVHGGAFSKISPLKPKNRFFSRFLKYASHICKNVQIFRITGPFSP
jgi:hypothetical protein